MRVVAKTVRFGRKCHNPAFHRLLAGGLNGLAGRAFLHGQTPKVCSALVRACAL